MKKIYVGIDPDVDGSGVAVLCVERSAGFQKPQPDASVLDLKNLEFAGLIDLFAQIREEYGSSVRIIVEAGWKNRSNWHLPAKVGKTAAAEIGRRTGRNHQIAIDIAQTAKFFGLDVIERLPLVKVWKGKDGKITHDEIAAFTGIEQKRTNQEQRDALLLAWTEANLPIRLKV